MACIAPDTSSSVGGSSLPSSPLAATTGVGGAGIDLEMASRGARGLGRDGGRLEGVDEDGGGGGGVGGGGVGGGGGGSGSGKRKMRGAAGGGGSGMGSSKRSRDGHDLQFSQSGVLYIDQEQILGATAGTTGKGNPKS